MNGEGRLNLFLFVHLLYKPADRSVVAHKQRQKLHSIGMGITLLRGNSVSVMLLHRCNMYGFVSSRSTGARHHQTRVVDIMAAEKHPRAAVMLSRTP